MNLIWKRIICLCLILVILMTSGGCSMVSDLFGPDPASPEDAFDQDVDREALEFESEYIRQHLAYIASGDYETVTYVTGGLPTLIAEHYETAGTDKVNQLWQWVSKGGAALAEGDIELVNEYEVLVAELMQSTGSDENFASGFEKSYYDAFVALFAGIHEYVSILKDTGDVFSADALDDVDELLEFLDEILTDIEKLGGASQDEAVSLFSDAFAELKEKLNVSFFKDNEVFLSGFATAVEVACGVTSAASESVEDMMDAYLFYTAMEDASEEWEEVWSDIAREARYSGTDEGEKISECILKLLNELKGYRKDSAKALIRAGVSSSGKNLAEFAFQMGHTLFTETLGKHPLITLIRGGIIGGVALANLLANCDNIAYFGQMMVGYGRVAEYAYEVMRDTERSLLASETYDNAVMFDAAFHIYKAVQMSAADCATSYCRAIMDAWLAGLFPSTTEDEQRDIEGLAEYRDLWSSRNCHGAEEVLNNGGLYVGYRGKVYYLRRNSAYLSETALFGNFGTDVSQPCELICRDSEGNETVLLTGVYQDGIYISGENIVLRDNNGVLMVTDLNGAQPKALCTGYVVDDIPAVGMLLYWDEGTQMYTASDLAASTYTLFGSGAIGLEVRDNRFYYYYQDGDILSFCYYSFDTRLEETMGIVDTGANVDDYWWGSIQSIQVTDIGIFLQYGWSAGTGNFYQGGSIFYIPISGEVRTLVHLDVMVPMFNVVLTEEEQTLHYNTVSVYSQYGPFYSAVTKDNSRMDLESRVVSASQFPICEMGQQFIHDGNLYVYNDNTAEPVLLMSGALIQSLGYEAFGVLSDASIVRAENVSIVGDTAYVTVTHMHRDPSVDIGWREGYRRATTVVYEVDLQKQEAVQVYSH